MATATVDYRNHLRLESIPVLDIRLLSQPELLSLSLCSSSPSPSNAETELFTPKIDRSIFNESAGSRKQTFFRLRFAGSRGHLHHQHSSPSSEPFIFPPRPLDLNPELDEESSNALTLLKSLLKIDDSMTANPVEDEPFDDKDLVPVQIEYPNGNLILHNIPDNIVSSSERKRKRGRPRTDVAGNWLVESEPLAAEEYKETKTFDTPNATADAGENPPTADAGVIPPTEDAGVIPPTAVILPTADAGVIPPTAGARENPPTADAGNGSNSNGGKRKRGRPRREESESRMIGNEGKKVDSEFEKAALRNVEKILGIEEELRRRTEGIVTEAQLLEFMRGLEGEWASKSQKKRIIDAAKFGDVLPIGWKLMLFVKRRVNNVWLACSRYIRFSNTLIFFTFILVFLLILTCIFYHCCFGNLILIIFCMSHGMHISNVGSLQPF